jgi:uncharacterized Zn finger protein
MVILFGTACRGPLREAGMARYRYGYSESFGRGWPEYVPVAERRRKAEKKVAELRKKGKICQPVVIEGRGIARSFWGKAWCDNLESYSDLENRLERGRTYVRNGSVIDLVVGTGKADALVSGSEIYKVEVTVKPLAEAVWKRVVKECTGKVGSLVELLQGKLSHSVMEVVTRKGTGLFPAPREIGFRCSCPDSAHLCKHIAAVLYGIGTRLDTQPDLLFQLRHVDPQELVLKAGTGSLEGIGAASPEDARLKAGDLSALFGIEIDEGKAAEASPDLSAPPALKKDSGRVARRAASPFPETRSVGKAHAAPAEPVKAATSAATEQPPKKTASRRRRTGDLVTARELAARGLPHHAVQNWLKAGVLQRTEQRGVYRTTKETEPRIAAYLSRPGRPES